MSYCEQLYKLKKGVKTKQLRKYFETLLPPRKSCESLKNDRSDLNLNLIKIINRNSPIYPDTNGTKIQFYSTKFLPRIFALTPQILLYPFQIDNILKKYYIKVHYTGNKTQKFINDLNLSKRKLAKMTHSNTIRSKK
jgi:hypothetical protein